MSNEQQSSEKVTVVRHASILDDRPHALCGISTLDVLNVEPNRLDELTAPAERVNCPMCRTILNHVRERYGRDGYTDIRLSAEDNRRALRDMYADLVGGEIEG